jgi:uncharacterized protein
MAAEALESCDVSWHGLAGDRRWAFIRPGIERSGFPWLTIREKADLWRYTPHFLDPATPNKSEVRVRTPSGNDLEVADPALAWELGPGVRLIKQDVGVFDTFPLSLISQQSVNALADASGVALTASRFRPNFLVNTGGAEPFVEDSWVGCHLRIGGLVMRVDKRDGRCAVVNVDPASLEGDARVLRTIAQQREGRVGVYGAVVEPGTVTLGDEIVIES